MSAKKKQITMSIYWLANSIILGLLWKRVQPHTQKQQVLE